MGGIIGGILNATHG
ncbi:hypothetical protein [Citrobacter portucalensis]